MQFIIMQFPSAARNVMKTLSMRVAALFVQVTAWFVLTEGGLDHLGEHVYMLWTDQSSLQKLSGRKKQKLP